MTLFYCFPEMKIRESRKMHWESVLNKLNSIEMKISYCVNLPYTGIWDIIYSLCQVLANHRVIFKTWYTNVINSDSKSDSSKPETCEIIRYYVCLLRITLTNSTAL